MATRALWRALLLGTVLLGGCAIPEPIPLANEGAVSPRSDGPGNDAPADLPTFNRDWDPDEADGGVSNGPRDGGVHDGPRDGGVHDGSARDQGAADKRRDGNPG